VTYDGMTLTTLAAAVRTPDLHVVAETPSTLDVVHALAEEGAPAGTVVLADAQTRGRGRQGSTWHSPRGRGIWMSYLARPPDDAAASLLAIRAGLAVAEALDALGIPVWLKWPNDVLCRDRKVAGILCETRWKGARPAWTALGIGMNVHAPLPPGVAETACALDELAPVTRRDVLERLLPRLHTLPVSPRLTDGERAAWRARDWLMGRSLRAPLSGIAQGIEGDGALRVETPGGVRRALAGHVILT
jgi:BirA family transcriptional regulator, biotin operon repressor / biotin---[acetyl-CoA-carboxylase] ligase